jgi:alpha-tubulin suppressor-like RCC1 family protein
VAVSNINNASAVSAGGGFACALLSGGTVQCWGNNDSQQLGNGANYGPQGQDPPNSSTPVTVSNLTTATAVSAGEVSACALLSGGTIQCWGGNGLGELGNGTTTNSSTPVAVSNITNATAVSAGYNFACALLSGGTVQCWGYNANGELGDGTTTGPQTCDGDPCSTAPTAVSNINSATAVSAGDAFACALLSGGAIQCWGYNSDGELGNGTTTINSTTPVAVSNINNATAVSAGYESACALLSGGTVQCWGDNSYGELGNGTTTSSSTPVTVSNINSAIAVSAGSDSAGGHALFACALLSSGTVQCWGDNTYGELGNGTTTSSSIPVTVTW